MIQNVRPDRTRIVLGSRLQWSTAEEAKRFRDEIKTQFAGWLEAWSAKETSAYLKFYDQDFSDGKRDLKAWSQHKKRVNSAKTWIKVTADNINIFRYLGERDLVALEYWQSYRSSNYNYHGRKVLFWRQDEEGRWKIVYEGSGQL